MKATDILYIINPTQSNVFSKETIEYCLRSAAIEVLHANQYKGTGIDHSINDTYSFARNIKKTIEYNNLNKLLQKEEVIKLIQSAINLFPVAMYKFVESKLDSKSYIDSQVKFELKIETYFDKKAQCDEHQLTITKYNMNSSISSIMLDNEQLKLIFQEENKKSFIEAIKSYGIKSKLFQELFIDENFSSNELIVKKSLGKGDIGWYITSNNDDVAINFPSENDRVRFIKIGDIPRSATQGCYIWQEKALYFTHKTLLDNKPINLKNVIYFPKLSEQSIEYLLKSEPESDIIEISVLSHDMLFSAVSEKNVEDSTITGQNALDYHDNV